MWATVLEQIKTVDLNNIFVNDHGTFMSDRLSVLQ